MSGEIRACEVKFYEGDPEVAVWKPGWLYGLKDTWSGARADVKAVVRMPGSLLLEELHLSNVRLVEEKPYPSPLGAPDPDEAELEEELKRTQERLKRLRGILVQLHSYLTNYQGSGLSEGVAEDLCKILDYPDPTVEDK